MKKIKMKEKNDFWLCDAVKYTNISTMSVIKGDFA